MSLSLTTNRQKQLLRELARLAETRLARSNEIELALSSGRRQADEQFDQIRGQLQEALDARTADAARGYRQELDEANAEFHREHTAVQAEYDALLVSIAQRHTSDSNEARRQRDVAVWEANAVFDATKDRPKQLYKKQKVRLQRLGKQLDAQWRAVEEIGEHGEQIARARHHKIDATARISPSVESASAGEGTPPSDASDPLKAFADAVEAVRQRHEVLRKQWLGNCFIGVRPLWFFFAFWLLAIIPAGFAFGWNRWQWIAMSLAASLGICLLAGAWLFPIARRRTAAAYSDVAGAIASAKAAWSPARTSSPVSSGTHTLGMPPAS